MAQKHIAIYVRVSTDQQDFKSQMPDLEKWAQSTDTPIKWYRDKFSGKTMSRPKWNELIRDINQIQTIVVWRLDRLGRTAKGLTALFDDLIDKKINLISLKDGIDLETPAGRLIANVLASVAQYETEVRRERILAGQAVAKSKGKKWGGRKVGQRYKVTDEQITVIQQMSQTGNRVAAIARATGLSRCAVNRYKF